MSITFLIERALDVVRDPGGHEHRFVVLVSRVSSIDLVPGQLLAVPLSTGEMAVHSIISTQRGFKRRNARPDGLSEVIAAFLLDPPFAAGEVQQYGLAWILHW